MKQIFFCLLLLTSLTLDLKSQAPYCASFAISDGIYDITKVEVFQGASNIFSNSSTCGFTTSGPGSMAGRYSYYRDKVINLNKGQTYTLQITQSSCSGPFATPIILVMYLDLNKNYIFDTPSERLVWTAPITNIVGGSIVFSANFTIPNSITIDSTVMRIVTASNNFYFPYPCADLSNMMNYSRGETEDYTVTFCDPIIRSLAISSPLCEGDSSGRIRVSPSGGTLPYRYSWSGAPYSSVDSIYHLAAGTYTLITRDSLGCKYYDTITISEPPPLSLSKAVDQTCQRYLSGKINLLGSGGTPPYSYQLGTAPYSATKSWSSLPKGSYPIAIRDTHLCIVRDTILIDTFPLYHYTKAIDSVYCQQGKGYINLISSGSSSDYTDYSYNGSAYLPTTFGNYLSGYTLNPGWHYLTLKDKNGCLYRDTTYLDTPPARSISLVTRRQVGCKSGSLGMIKVAMKGKKSSMTYSYQWSHQGYASTSVDSMDNLPAGVYTIRMVDNLSCQVDSIVVTLSAVSPNLKISHRLTKPHICYTDTFNTIHIIPSGGTAPYIYSYRSGMFNSGAFSPWTAIDSYPIKHEPSYDVFVEHIRVTDASGCSFDSVLEIYPQSLPIIQMTQTVVGCGNTNKVHFQGLDLSHAALPILYSFDGFPYQSDSIFNGLSGNQKVPYSFKDNLGCVYKDSFFINDFPKLNTSFSTVSNSCLDSSRGNITVTANGGTWPYRYRINSGPWQKGTTFFQLKDGKHYIETIDTVNCLQEDSIIIPTLRYKMSLQESQPILCFGDKGTLVISLSGADILSGVTYSINGGAMNLTNSYPNLSAGIYQFRIKYNINCLYDTTYILKQPAIFTGNISNTLNPVLCFGDKTSLINIAPIGGTLPYSLYLNKQSKALANITNLSAGTYQVEIKDKNLCTDSAKYVITEPSQLKIIVDTIIYPTCNGLSDGYIKISSSGGVNPHQYIWSNGSSTPSINSLNSGQYKLTLTDLNLCKEYLTINLTNPSIMTLSDTVTQITCFGANDGKIKISVSGGKLPYRYLWDDASTLSYRIGLKGNTPYSITVTDNGNCSLTKLWSLVEPNKLSLKSSQIDATCYNTFDGSIKLSSSGGNISPSSQYTYSIDSQARVSSSSFDRLIAKLYKLSVYDDNLCRYDTIIQINSYPKQTISLDPQYNVTKLGESILINSILQGSTTDIKYRWLPSRGLTCTDCLQPTFNGYISTRYSLLYTYNNDKCQDSIQTYVIVPQGNREGIYIPTGFSPNLSGDKENETFIIYGSQIKSMKMSVFSRTGEKVFETTDINKGWDGTFKNEPLPLGEYNYTIRIILLDNQVIEKNGSVTLLR